MAQEHTQKQQPEPRLVRQIWLIGFDDGLASAVSGAWRPAEGEIRRIANLEEAPDATPEVLCFGVGTSLSQATEFIERIAERGAPPSRSLVLAAGSDLRPIESLVERDLLFYLTSRPPDLDSIVALLEAAWHTEAQPSGDSEVASNDLLRLLAQLERSQGPEEATQQLEEAAGELVQCREAECRWYDSETQTFWRPGNEAIQDSAAAGLVGFVARTGRSVCLEQIGNDSRYDAEADNRSRSSKERFLAVALPTGLSAQPVEAVLSLTRGGRHEPFDESSRGQIEQLAHEAGPILRRRRLAFEAARRRSATELFRSEALAHRQEGLQTRAEPLRIAPPWLGLAYRAVLAVCLLGVLALPFAGSDEFAVGPAVVRLKQRVEVHTRAAGVLEEFEVQPGDQVARGQEIGRLDSSEEIATLEQLRQELELRLVERLRHPDQEAAASTFVALRERQRVAAARLDRLRLRAPEEGVIGDLLARPGRPLVAGQPVASVIIGSATDKPSIDILLPGRFRPLLEPGMEVRFKIDGYPDVEHKLEALEISRQVISPQQAQALIQKTSGTVVGSGSGASGGSEGLVIVRAQLPDSSFASDGEQYSYFDGMTGTAELRVRKKRFLVDWLRKIV